MKFLVACDHDRKIFDTPSAAEARAQFTCKRCVVFDLEAEKWRFKDVRIYRSFEADALAVASKEPLPARKKPVRLDQLDWVELKL